MRQLGIKTKDEILELGIEKFNDGVPRVGAAVHRRVADYVTRQARWVDFEQRLQDAQPRLHGVGDLGVQAAATTRAWSTRASACCPTAGTTRRRCPTTSCGWTTTSTRSARTPSVTVWVPSWRPASGCWRWTTTPWTLPSNLAIVVGPDIDYVVVESDARTGRALPPRRGAAGGVRARAAARTRPSRVVAPAHGRRPRRPALHPASTSSPTTAVWGTEQAFRVVAARLRHHRRRHRPRAHAPARSARTTRWSCDAAGIATVITGRRRREVHRPVADTPDAVFDANLQVVRGQPAAIIAATCEAAGPSCVR